MPAKRKRSIVSGAACARADKVARTDSAVVDLTGDDDKDAVAVSKSDTAVSRARPVDLYADTGAVEFLASRDVFNLVMEYVSWFAAALSIVCTPRFCPPPLKNDASGLASKLQLAASKLVVDGVAVVPMFGFDELVGVSGGLDDAVAGFPEYLALDAKSDDGDLVQGGFGALGNASSFHNDYVRKLRMRWHFMATAFFRYYDAELESKSKPDKIGKIGKTDNSDMQLEQLVDRVLYRSVGKVPAAESAHRDQSPCLPGDHVFGGWVNLNHNRTHYFSCVPGSQQRVGHDTKAGFNKLTPAQVKHFKSLMKEIGTRSQSEVSGVECPPGHWIVFNQNIVHRVLARRSPVRVKRLFAGWRLTTSRKPLLDQRQCMIAQGVPKIPSEQDPTVWPQMYWVNHLDTLVDWSAKTFKPFMVGPKVMQSGDLAGKSFQVVAQKAPSLQHLHDNFGVEMYAPYRAEELDILEPQPLHSLPPITCHLQIPLSVSA